MRRTLTALCLTAAAGTAQAQGFSGTAEAWAQWVIPAHVISDGAPCGSGGYEFCSSVTGGGAYAGGAWFLDQTSGIYFDAVYDHHKDSNSYKSGRGDSSRYHGLGLHYFWSANQDPWGVYATWADGNNHADSDSSGPIWGIGAEKAWGNSFLQAGHMRMKDDGTAYDQDGIEDLSYINAGHRWAFGQGELSVNLALGAGDFEESLDEDRGEWVQAGLRYEAPLGKRFKWFTEYQGDFVKVERTYETNKVIFHTVKFGLSVPLGQASKAPFRTPNFRAPIANAGEMN